MLGKPVIYKSTHTIKFSDLDPYNHMRTAMYSSYYIDHRMDCLRKYIGWDIKTLSKLPFMIWVRRMEIDFLQPAIGDQEISITSFVRDFQGPNAYIECNMVDTGGNNISRCLMVVAYVDKNTSHATAWPNDIMMLFFEKEPAREEFYQLNS